MKRIFTLFLVFSLVSCGQLQDIAENLPSQGGKITNSQIAQGLKAALQKGIDEQVSKLASENGFYTHKKFRIPLPEELQKVEEGLRDIGLGNLADRGIKAINEAATEAVSRATPIFVSAIQDMTLSDARSILLGDQNAATQYLKQKTSEQLYQEFKPIISSSFQEVGAEQIWSSIINKYNSIPLTQNVNPNLTDYVTDQALNSVYTAIAQEEKEIRTQLSERTSDLLRRVFSLQD